MWVDHKPIDDGYIKDLSFFSGLLKSPCEVEMFHISLHIRSSRAH